MKNYYKELGLDPELDKKEIEAKLKALHKRVRSKADNASTRKKRAAAYERLEIIEEALDILLDNNKRIEYDNRLFQNEDGNENKDTKKDDTKLSYLNNSAETNKNSNVYIVNERTKNKENNKTVKNTIVNDKQTTLSAEDEEIKLDFDTIEKYRKMSKELEDKLDRELVRRGFNNTTSKESSKDNHKQSIGVGKLKEDNKIKKDNRSLQEKEWTNSLEEVNALHEKVKKREKIRKETEVKKKTVDTYAKRSINQSRNDTPSPNNTSCENETNTISPHTDSNPEKQNIFVTILGYILGVLFLILRFIFTKGGFIATLLICGILFLTINPQYMHIFDSDKYNMYVWIKNYDYTKLHWYVSTENTELAIKEIEKKKGINKQADDGDTPLHLAVEKANAELVTRLIEAGADLNLQDEDGNTPLHIALKKGYTELVSQLVEAGADVNIQNNEGEYIIDKIISLTGFDSDKEKDDFILSIIDSGAVYSENTLTNCIRENVNIEIVERLIKMGTDVNKSDQYGSIPLCSAARWDNLEAAKLLINNGADVNVKDEDGNTAIHCANYEIAKLLIANGADVNVKNENGVTPIFFEEYETAKLLIANGAHVNIVDDRGSTPMFFVDDKETVRLFVQKGLKVNTTNNFGETPLHYVNRDDAEVVEELIKYGADVNAQDNDGNTPLHEVTKGYGSEYIFLDEKENKEKVKKDMMEDRNKIRLLLEAGADTTIENNIGNTALECVEKDSGTIKSIFKKYSK